MRDLLDVVDDRLPAWRTQRPYRTRAAAWPSRPVEIGGHPVELFVLPVVGLRWYYRGRTYWWRRIRMAVLLAVGIVTITGLDVGVALAAAGVGDLGWAVAVLVVLFVAGLFFWYRPDLFARSGTPNVAPLPGPLKAVCTTLGLLGLALTPGWTLGFFYDLLPRFPVQEREAWQFAVFQMVEARKAA